jgi:saccharopine dehydrogenase-like NADP-dependent oxidoreductase
VSRILVLGGSGEMGSAAVADLVERTDHEVTIGDIRTDAAGAVSDTHLTLPTKA